MKEIGIQGIGFSDYDLSIDFARKIVGLRYNVDSRKINSVRQAVRTGSIAMVCDDMREHRLLDALLNNEKIDSGSFGNPGGLAPLTQLAPYSVHTITETEANVRLGEIARNLRRAVHVFMRKNIKPEGKLTLYERAQYPGTPREEDVLATIEKILGEEKQYWEKPVVSVSQQSFVNKNQVGAGVTWYGMERDYASHHTTSPLSLIVCQIQRRTDL